MPSRSSTLSRLPRRAAAVVLTAVVAIGALAAPASAAPATVSPSEAIEDFAPYQGQSACEPVARPGVESFRDLVLAAYPGTGDSGIVRDCSVGGTSEHKEGRAWDWRVSASNPTHVLQVADLMEWLLAEDEFGNAGAMARRLGVMYVIWDSRIWKSYQSAQGWQPYSGASPHTDHVHVSFSWAGALAATSYWSGEVAPVMSRPVPVVEDSDLATDTPLATLYEQKRDLKRSLPGPWRRH